MRVNCDVCENGRPIRVKVARGEERESSRVKCVTRAKMLHAY